MDTVSYEDEGIEVSAADIELLATTSEYFAAQCRRRRQLSSPPDSHVILFPPSICNPERVFRLYFRYT